MLLVYLRAHQKLAPPAVRTALVPGSNKLQIDLPEQVLDYTSEILPITKLEEEILPKDTTISKRRYFGRDKSETILTVVLMGTDRTSMHRPRFCLSGQGWAIDDIHSKETTVRLERPFSYDLPVTKLLANKEVILNGTKATVRGIYLHWFVAEDEYTARHGQCMWWMARDMLRTGVLKRWAYVSYFSWCFPDQEEAAFERMKTLIAASVPEFQLTPSSPGSTASARP